MERLLITGGSGLLGVELVHHARRNRLVFFTFLKHRKNISGAKSHKLEILDKAQCRQLLQKVRPDAVIHTAYSKESLDVITEGTANIVAAAASIGCKFVQISTDAIFDGKLGGYNETSVPKPIHHYGRAKLAAENAVRKAELASFVIVRTSLLLRLKPFDERTSYLAKQLKSAHKPVYFTDEYRCPIIVSDLAKAVLELLDNNYKGVINIAGPERISRYELARKLARYLGLNQDNIIPGLSSTTGIVRPLDCSLDTSLSLRLLQTKIPGVTDVLKKERNVR